MKKLLLLLFLVIGLSFVVQAIPAVDPDVGGVTYVMPTQQINTVFDFAMVPALVRPVMLCEYSMDRITPMQADAKQIVLCTIEVISPPPYSQSWVACIINNPTDKETNFT